MSVGRTSRTANASVPKEAMRMFLGGRCYTAENLEKDYLAELAGYSDERWEAPHRAARLAAAVKRFKTSEML